MARVERIVIVETVAANGSTDTRRYALLDSGERIEDPGYHGRGYTLGPGPRPPADSFRELAERTARESAEHRDPRYFRRLAATLTDAGVEITPAELAALPFEVEVDEVDDLPLLRLTPEQERMARRMRIVGWILVVIAGAIWPSRTRYATWKRHTWGRRIAGGLAAWAFGNLIRELLRQPPPR